MKMTPRELYEALVAAMPADQIDHHESDLYVKVTDTSMKILHQSGLIRGHGYTTFVDQITKTLWYDIAFCYSPFWEEHARKQEGEQV